MTKIIKEYISHEEGYGSIKNIIADIEDIELIFCGKRKYLLIEYYILKKKFTFLIIEVDYEAVEAEGDFLIHNGSYGKCIFSRNEKGFLESKYIKPINDFVDGVIFLFSKAIEEAGEDINFVLYHEIGHMVLKPPYSDNGREEFYSDIISAYENGGMDFLNKNLKIFLRKNSARGVKYIKGLTVRRYRREAFKIFKNGINKFLEKVLLI